MLKSKTHSQRRLAKISQIHLALIVSKIKLGSMHRTFYAKAYGPRIGPTLIFDFTKAVSIYEILSVYKHLGLDIPTVARLLLRELTRMKLYCHGHRALLMFTIQFESFWNEITKLFICLHVFTRSNFINTYFKCGIFLTNLL